MSSFACNWPWLFGGLIGGWLLWHLFDKTFRRDGEAAGMRVRRDLELANSRVGSLQGELAGSREQLGLLRTEVVSMNDTVRVRSEDVTRLEAELGEWTSKHAALESSSAEHASRLESVGAAAAATAAAALAAATAKYASLRTELDEATAAIAGHVATHGSLEGELERSRAAFATLQQELESERSKHRWVSGELEASRTALAGVRMELEACAARRTVLEEEMARSAASSASAQALASAAEFGFTPRRSGRDDLLIIEGIGPKINELLRAGGIDTFATLATAPVADVQAILDAAGPNFRLANPASWARQSAMCAAGEWSALRSYQDTLRAGVDASRASKQTEEQRMAAAAEFGFVPRRAGRDDLTIVEGIGPKINELLIAGGIDTFARLAAAPVTQVQAILDEAGPNFRMANPASWAEQSALCERGKWSALKTLQDSLRAGVDTTRGDA